MAFSLNPQQDGAVRALRGNVLIAAGAGSGKTRTLSERFVHALTADAAEEWSGAEPGQVLTITFTEKAAGELAERVRSTLRQAGRPEDARAIDHAWISTIHGFCARVLRRYALEAGLDPLFSVPDSVEAKRLQEQAFDIAARAVMEMRDGARLFGDFEFRSVFSAAMRVAGELRTRGLGTESLRTEATRPAEEIWSEAYAALGPASGAIAACNDSGIRMAQLRLRCEVAAGTLACIQPTKYSDEDLALVVWRALAAVKPGKSGTKKTAEVHAELSEQVTRLTADAAAAAAAPYARALVALVDGFLDEFAAIKASRGLLDFDDLQHETLRLFRVRPDVADECRARFRLTMVDEFQDTDALQLAIVRSVAGTELCTVGDEHQSIYGFRGADIEVFREHERAARAAGGRTFRLAANYRSHGAILAFVNTLFSNSELFGADLLRLEHGRVESDSSSLPPDLPRIELAMVHKEGSAQGEARATEAALIAERFAELRDAHRMNAGEMVILLRNYRHAEEYAQALRAKGFEASVVGGSRFLTLPEVTALRALVAVIANTQDECALLKVLCSDLGRVSDDGLLVLTRREDGEHPMTLWEALGERASALSEHDRKRAMTIRRAIARAQERVAEVGLWETILLAAEECGLDLVLLSRGDQGRQAFANVLKLARLAADFEEGGAGDGAAAFSAYLDSREAYGEHTPPATLVDEKSRAVRIMSIHSSKGLEFPVVAVVGLGTATKSDTEVVRVRPGSHADEVDLALRLPSSANHKGAERPRLFAELDQAAKLAEAEEGKRLFYVACTRAREILVLSGAANFTKPPGASENPLVWLRTALPQLEAGIGEEPALKSVGDWPVRVEIAVAGPDEVAEEALEAVPEASEPDTDEAYVPRVGATSSAPDRLSYSDLALFGECAKRFWAQRVLRLGAVTVSAAGDPMRFGTAVHAALRVTADGPPDSHRVDAIARYFELGEEDAAGLASAVSAFLGARCARELEACEVVRREWGFGILMGEAGCEFSLVGSIDAYGRSGHSGLIIDYKTGSSGEAADLRERYELQARCYALIALRDGCETVRVVFCRPQVIEEDGTVQEVEFTFTRSESAALEAEVVKAHDRMVADDYPALQAWNAEVCEGCPIVGTLCEISAPGKQGSSQPSAR